MLCFQVTTLVVAEQVGGKLGAEALCTITAAGHLGGPITVLVAGHSVRTSAEQAACVPGVSQVWLHSTCLMLHACMHAES